MKTSLALFFAVLFLNCMYIVREPRDVAQSQNVTPPAVTVGLVGFYPYLAKDITPAGESGPRKFQAEVLYNDRGKQLLGIGRPISELIVDGADYTVPPARVQEFMDTYLAGAGKSGAKELSAFIVQEDGKPRLKNTKAKYIVVGIHQPALEEPQSPTLTLVTTVVSALTLGIIPQYANFVGTSRFLIYDAKLNLRKTVEYKSEYVRLFSIILIPLRNDEVEGVPNVRQSPYPRAWDADILDFRLVLSRFLAEADPGAPATHAAKSEGKAEGKTEGKTEGKSEGKSQ